MRRQFRGGIFGQINYTLSEDAVRLRSAPAARTGSSRSSTMREKPELDAGYWLYHNAHIDQRQRDRRTAFRPRASGTLNGNGIVDAVVRGGSRLRANRPVAERRAAVDTVRPRHVQPSPAGRTAARSPICNTAVSTLTRVIEIKELHRHPQDGRRHDLLDRSEGDQPGDGPCRRRPTTLNNDPGLRRPGVLQPRRGPTSATCRRWRSTRRGSLQHGSRARRSAPASPAATRSN